MALWWFLLAVGTLLAIVLGAIVVTRSSEGRRIPRLGALTGRQDDAPRWARVGLMIGFFLMAFASGMQTETFPGYLAVFGSATAVAALAQTVVVAKHNRRLAPGSHGDAAPTTRPGVGDQSPPA